MLALLAAVALATKPCPASPCEGAACADVAVWVAVGRIEAVVHDVQGEPLFKDFARFAFVPTRWEQAPPDPTQRVTFQVGWCDNGLTLPDDTSGEFRFYGANAPTAERPLYLWFDRVGEVRDRRDLVPNEGQRVLITGLLRREEGSGFAILTPGGLLVPVEGEWSEGVGQAVTVTCTLSGGRASACAR